MPGPKPVYLSCWDGLQVHLVSPALVMQLVAAQALQRLQGPLEAEEEVGEAEAIDPVGQATISATPKSQQQ